MKKTTGKPIEILLVEDNPGDVRLTQEALKEGRILNNLTIAWDGAQAMEYLSTVADGSASSRPDIILLDLNLPRKNGIEVLKEIKSNEKLRQIPVVILTTSDDERDILKSYSSHANCYITKPVDLVQFLNVVKSIEDFWLTIVRLPNVPR